MRVEFYDSGTECVRRKSGPALRSHVSHRRLDSTVFLAPIRQEGREVLLASIAQRSAQRPMKKSPGLSNPNKLRRSSPCLSAISFFAFS